MTHPLLPALPALAAGALLACAACAPEGARDDRPLVGVSVLPQAWFVERLAGGSVAVLVMIPPGASPALYEPTLAQVEQLQRAALYLRVGHPALPFERAWLDRLLSNGGPDAVASAWAGPGEEDGDPHVWTTPEGARRMARRTADALAELLPEERTAIEERHAALRAEIDAVDAELRERLGPLRGARFYVFHPAWSRFADAYGLEQVAIERDGKSPDTGELAALLARARADRVPVIFVQPQMSEDAARVVADAVGARVETLDPLARDWAANLRRVGERIAAGAVR